jgi:hypothetical protein
MEEGKETIKSAPFSVSFLSIPSSKLQVTRPEVPIQIFQRPKTLVLAIFLKQNCSGVLYGVHRRHKGVLLATSRRPFLH